MGQMQMQLPVPAPATTTAFSAVSQPPPPSSSSSSAAAAAPMQALVNLPQTTMDRLVNVLENSPTKGGSGSAGAGQDKLWGGGSKRNLSKLVQAHQSGPGADYREI